MDREMLFYEYYEKWMEMYKNGAVRPITYKKYQSALFWLKKLVPNLKVKDLNRMSYQTLMNEYAKEHEHQTVVDFSHHVKAAVLDALDEGLIERNPTRKVVLKGKQPRQKKQKFLNQYELKKLIDDLDLGNTINWDWLILLIAKTGVRFSEALGLTPDDFDFQNQRLNINKTWNYKDGGGFDATKNKSSVRKIPIDWQLVMQFSHLTKDMPNDKPIFVTKEKIYNSTVNGILERHCDKVGIPVISVHGLRHTHASILLYNGCSTITVSRRLGHANITTTQKTYLHVIQELENKDIDIVMRSVSGL